MSSTASLASVVMVLMSPASYSCARSLIWTSRPRTGPRLPTPEGGVPPAPWAEPPGPATSPPCRCRSGPLPRMHAGTPLSERRCPAARETGRRVGRGCLRPRRDRSVASSSPFGPVGVSLPPRYSRRSQEGDWSVTAARTPLIAVLAVSHAHPFSSGPLGPGARRSPFRAAPHRPQRLGTLRGPTEQRTEPCRPSLEHALHLAELAEQIVDLLRRRPAATGDPHPARAVDDRGVATFRWGHGTHDRLDARHLFVVHLLGGLPNLLRHARHELHDAAERTQLPDLLKLLEEIVERQPPLEEPTGRSGDDLLVHRPFGLLDEGEDVSHAQDPIGHAVGMEQVEIVETLTGRSEDDRPADHLLDRERSAPPGVAVELRQDHAVEVEC